ncbi:MAG: multiprotein bridging factor aMBF1 [Desulfurococcaceae archaeon]
MPYCELCGREVRNERELYRVYFEGTLMRVCAECYSKIVRERSKAQPPRAGVPARQRPLAQAKRRSAAEEYEVVEDYAKRVREARMRLGWSEEALAQRVRESENVIKRIEAGKLKPSIDLARRLEKVLGITLLEPVVEEPSGVRATPAKGTDEYYTVGDFVRFSEEQ